MNKRTDLQGKIALVTGAGRGIGAAISRELGASGCHVVLAGRTEGPLQTVAKEIRDSGGQASLLVGDISTDEWLDDLATGPTPVNIFIHAAATFAPYGPLEEQTPENIQSVIGTSLTAALRISAALLPQMKQDDYGRLIFIGSRAASLGAANQVAYATAKGGLEAMVKSLTVETAHTGITAHLLELGLIDTERTRESMSDSARNAMAEATPAGRIGTPEDVVGAIRYLLSPEAEFLRGVILNVDGGLGLGLATSKGRR